MVPLTKLRKTFSITSYQLIYSKIIEVKTELGKLTKTLSLLIKTKIEITVYILSNSMIKHINGRNISDSTNVKVRSHPYVTTEDIIHYVKPIACKKPKNVGYTYQSK